MEIKTKFNIGEKVWAIINGEPMLVTFQTKGGVKQEITPKGHIKQGVSIMFNKQMLFLMGIKDKL